MQVRSSWSRRPSTDLGGVGVEGVPGDPDGVEPCGRGVVGVRLLAVLEVTADDAVEPRRGCDVDGTLTWQQDGARFELTRLEPSLTVG